MNERRALLAAIHIARKELAIADDAWPELVQRVAGAPSCAMLSDDGLRAVKAELARLGARFTGPRFASAPPGKFVKAKKPTARKIWAQWTDLGRRGLLRNPSREACRAFCARMAGTGAAATDPDFLTAAQAQPVIEALKAMQERGTPEPEDTVA